MKENKNIYVHSSSPGFVTQVTNDFWLETTLNFGQQIPQAEKRE